MQGSPWKIAEDFLLLGVTIAEDFLSLPGILVDGEHRRPYFSETLDSVFMSRGVVKVAEDFLLPHSRTFSATV